VRTALRALALFALVVACDKSKSAEPDPTPAPAPKPTPTVASLSPRISRPAPSLIVAIGDLHGDLEVTRKALRLAGAIDESDVWIGGKLVVVQTGDAIDRGDDDRKILDLLERLKADAKKAGGELIALSGNHELMNAQLDFRYVTPGAFTAFGDVKPSDAVIPRISNVEVSARGRAAAFAPGGSYAAMIAERPIVVKVGDSVFVHGGILPKHVKYGLDKMDEEIRAWLSGTRSDLPKIVSSEDGPVWTRMYSAAPSREDCAVLSEALTALGAKRMVMGHTVQRNGINPACDDRAWRIDTGLSKFFGGKLEVLEIRGDVVTVKKAD
jgi:hypothetical protein